MNKRFEVLDAFRGICALSVVVFHMHLVDSFTNLDFFRGSDIFVEFFFVLSGFVLTHGYGYKKNLQFKAFIKSRFFRIYPLHLFMFVVFILLEFGKLGAYKFGGFTFTNEPFTNRFALSEMIPNLLLIQSWTPFTDPLSFNVPSWSISIEFYLYVILFFTIVMFGKFRKLIWLLIPIVIFLLMIMESDVLVTNVLRGLSCFFGGAFTYVVYKKVSHRKVPYFLASMIEIGLLITTILVIQTEFEYRSIIATLLFYLVVFCFAFEGGMISSALKIKPFQLAGKLSYSIYMTHAAILFCLTSVMVIVQKITAIELAPTIDGVRYLTTGNGMINNVIVICILGLVMLISNITYKYVEQKGLALAKQKNKVFMVNVNSVKQC